MSHAQMAPVATSEGQGSDFKLEVVVLPVTDVDRAKRFYTSLGWREDADFATSEFHHAGTEARVAGPAPEHADYGSFASFRDPDGNGWLLQEIKVRLPGRV